MNTKYGKKSNGGFSIIELVIVIAVIAILAAILIPTFSSIIEKAQFSKDLSAVRNMNELLAIDVSSVSKKPDFETVKAILENGSYKIPYKTSRAENDLYWMPSENSIVIYDTEAHAIIYPKNYMGIEKEIDWILISEESASPIGESTTAAQAETTAEPQNPTQEDTTAAQAETTASHPEETTAQEKQEESSDIISEIIDWFRRLFGW